MTRRNHKIVTIFVTCLNFAGTGLRILLPPLSSSRRVIPSRKIALNSNGEVNYQELARRPWCTMNLVAHKCMSGCIFIAYGCTGRNFIFRNPARNCTIIIAYCVNNLQCIGYSYLRVRAFSAYVFRELKRAEELRLSSKI